MGKSTLGGSSKKRSTLGGGGSGKSGGSSGGVYIPGGGGGGGIDIGGLAALISRSPVGKALEILDLPRAAQLADVRQRISLLQGKGYNLKEAQEQAARHEGVGDLIKGANIPGGIWSKRLLGFVGDVATDPLTYVSGGASIPAKSGGRAVRLTRKGVATKLEDAGLDAAAERALRRGAPAAGREALQEAGVDIGLRVGGVHVPGSEALSEALNKITGPVRERIGDSGVGSSLRSSLGGRTGELETLLRDVPGGSVIAHKSERADKLARAAGRSIRNAGEKDLATILKTHKEALDPDSIRRAMEGAEDIADNPAALELRRFFDDLASTAEEITGRSIPRIENYLPHRLTPEAKASRASQFKGKAGRVTAEMQRTIEGTIDDINAASKLFKDNPIELAHQYIGEMQRMVERWSRVRKLGDLAGAGGPLTKEVPTQAAKAANRTASRIEKALEKLDPNILKDQADEALARGEQRLVGAADLREQAVAARAAVPALTPVPRIPRKVIEGRAQKAATTAPVARVPDVKRVRELKKALDDNEGLLARVKAFGAKEDIRTNAAAIYQVNQRVSQLTDERAALIREAEEIRDRMKGREPVDPAVVEQAKERAAKVVEEDAPKFEHPIVEPERIAVVNEARLEELAAKQERAFAKRELELEARTQASKLFQEAAKMRAAGRRDLARVAELEATAEVAAAEMPRAALDLEMLRRHGAEKQVVPDLKATAERGLLQLADGRYAEEWVTTALQQIDEMFTPQKIGAFLKLYDAVTARMRAYALLSPGYHSRNFFGGMWNNSLAGMNPKAYWDYFRIRRGRGTISELDRAAFAAMERDGILEGSNVLDLGDITNTSVSSTGLLGPNRRRIDPTNLENPLLALNTRGARAVERELRGPLYLDVYRRTGGDAEAALDAVMTYHFDYADLSKFEQTHLKRITFFYTWMRKNFPLQVENMLRQPGKYNRYTHFKRNLELGTEEDETVPSYYGDLLAIRLPFKIDGNRIYATPDLPFVGLSKTLDPSQAASGLNPLIKTPVESFTNYKMFEQRPFSPGLRDAPNTWLPLLYALRVANGKFGLPKVYTSADGQLMMSEQAANKIESLIPVLGRMRRLAPSEDKYQDRAYTTWFSFVFGLGGRTLDEASIQGELLRRQKDEQSRARLEKELTE